MSQNYRNRLLNGPGFQKSDGDDAVDVVGGRASSHPCLQSGSCGQRAANCCFSERGAPPPKGRSGGRYSSSTACRIEFKMNRNWLGAETLPSMFTFCSTLMPLSVTLSRASSPLFLVSLRHALSAGAA